MTELKCSFVPIEILLHLYFVTPNPLRLEHALNLGNVGVRSRLLWDGDRWLLVSSWSSLYHTGPAVQLDWLLGSKRQINLQDKGYVICFGKPSVVSFSPQ